MTKPLPPPSFRRGKRASEGFTLLEVLAGIVLLAITVAGALGSIASGGRQLNQGRDRNERLSEIDRDQATILEQNDRYSCTSLPASGAADDDCAVVLVDLDPNENQYAPDPVPAADYDGSGYQRFVNLCASSTLRDALITELNDPDSVPPPPGFARLGITRVVDPSTTGEHAYVVRWRAQGQLLRSLELTPTVAKWCP